MPINHKQLRRNLEAARKDRTPQRFFEDLRESLDEGELKPSDFSVRQLFEEFVPDGRELVNSFNPAHPSDINLMEAGNVVDTSAFSNITGQIVYTAVMAEMMSPTFIGDQLFETVPTNLSGEKIPGIGRIGDEAMAIGEGQDYPTAGLAEEWVETPETIKRGLIVPLTKEVIFFDRTGILIGNASKVGEAIGINKEKRMLDVALGITTTWRYKGNAAQATYANTHTGHDFDNLANSNALADWTDIETAELLFDAITDPNTGEPVMIVPNQLVVPSALKHTARRILSATEVRGGTSNTTNYQTIGNSPIPANQYSVLSNSYVKQRTTSATSWFIGDFKKAFKYMQNWAAVVQEAGEDSHDSFHRDIVRQWKVSERGAAACVAPWNVVKCTG